MFKGNVPLTKREHGTFKAVQLREYGLCKFHGTLTLHLGELSKVKRPGTDPGKNLTIFLDAKC